MFNSDIQVHYDYAKGLANKCVNNGKDYFLELSSNTSDSNTSITFYCGDMQVVLGTYDIKEIQAKNYKRMVINYTSSTNTSNMYYLTSAIKSGPETIFNSSIAKENKFFYTNLKDLEIADILSTTSISTGSENSSNLPFNRNEFYLIPFLLSVLIIIIFLKWCFPSRGGKTI